METPEIDTNTYGPLIFIRGAKMIKYGNVDLYKWCGKIEYPYGK